MNPVISLIRSDTMLNLMDLSVVHIYTDIYCMTSAMTLIHHFPELETAPKIYAPQNIQS